MKRAAFILMLIGLSACRTAPRKPCNVERICFGHRDDMLKALKEYPDMMKDILKTIADLENEAGGYK
jgi:hypothetical protein